MERTDQQTAQTLRAQQGEFNWVDLAAKDLEAQTRFYEALFGWSHRDVAEPGAPVYRMFTLDGAIVAGASQLTPEMMAAPVPSVWNTYLAADDVDGLANRAAGLGAQVFMPPMDAAKEVRLAGIQDPTGAPVFLLKSSGAAQAGAFGVPGALMWNDLNTRRPEKAMAFYTGLLPTWRLQQVRQGPAPYWTIEVGGQAEGGIMPMPESVPGDVPAHWLVYFGVEDAYAAAEKAKSLGATATMEPMDVGVTVFDVLADPFGAIFAVMTPAKG